MRRARSIGGPAVRNMGTVGGNLFAPAPMAISPSRCSRSTPRSPCRAALARATCRSRNFCNRASGRPARWCWRSPARRPSSADAFRYRKIARIKPKGGSVHHAGRASAGQRRTRARRAHRAAARWRRRRFAPRPPSGRWKARTLDAAAHRRRGGGGRSKAPRPPTTRSPAPGIAAKSSASICAACCPVRR